MRLYSIAVVVSDAKKAAKWYVEKLGFEVRSQEGHWITVAPKDSQVEIHLCEGPPLEPGNTGIAFKTDDVRRTYEELTKRGVKFSKPPRNEGWGMYAMFMDEDGNEFWLFE